MGEQIQFSKREKQVIDLLILGKSNKQIALALGLSVRTIEFHLSKIYSKLGVASRTEAVLKLSQTQLRESTGHELRKSTVPETDKTNNNVDTSISTRRSPMNKPFFNGLVLLILIVLVCLLAMIFIAIQRQSGQEVSPESTHMPVATLIVPTETSTLVISSQEHGLKQIQQLAAECEQGKDYCLSSISREI